MDKGWNSFEAVPAVAVVVVLVTAIVFAISGTEASRAYGDPPELIDADVDTSEVASDGQAEESADLPTSASDSNDASSTKPDASGAKQAVDKLLKGWEKPRFVFFVTGRQHGYIEPCGCTGLDKAKGGLSRRYTMLREIRKRGWNVIPVDVGNQVRRFGYQADIKFQRTADILKRMNYAAVAFGPDDLRLSLNGLLAPVHEANNFVVSNVSLLDLNRSVRIIESPPNADNSTRIGITGILGLGEQKKINRGGEGVDFTPPNVGINKAIAKFEQANTEFNVLLANASVKETEALVKKYPTAFDLVVTAGGAGEPTNIPAVVEGAKSKIIQTGTKGMYVGLVGVFDDEKRPIRYIRATLDVQYEDSPEVMEIFEDYQSQLEIQGLDGLGVKPIEHPSGHRFVGHEKCAECHTEAADVFEKTPHHHATESLIHPPNSRGNIPRHFDPECLSCHVTGWDAKNYLPFESGYLNVTMSKLHANGCENCHGPGSAHVAAEEGGDFTDAEIKELQEEMRLTLKEAKETKCYECHDIDNSPDFDFDTYWPKVKHVGKD